MSGKPELSQELNKGLILAVGGFCQQQDRFLFKVNSYLVAMDNGQWHCNCPGNDFSTINELYGHTGKICKHICAIALCFSVNVWIDRPKNIFNFIERLVDINYVFDCQLPNSKVKIKINDDDLRLLFNRKKSDILATQSCNGWQMNNYAKENYEDFVEKINE